MKIVELKLLLPMAATVLETATPMAAMKNISATTVGRYFVALSAASASAVSRTMSHRGALSWRLSKKVLASVNLWTS